jgi:hypothetical protein
MGEEQNRPFKLSLNTSLKVDFQGSRETSRRRLDSSSGVGRTVGLRRTHQTVPDGLSGKECALALRRPATINRSIVGWVAPQNGQKRGALQHRKGASAVCG